MKSKISLLVTTIFVVTAILFYACQKDVKQSSVSATDVSNGKVKLSPPTLTCGTSTGASINIQVCAGPSGAPAGFSVQWMTKADYDIYGWQGGAPSYCAASFSGVPGCKGSNKYNLAANACVTVNIGENIFDDCGASSQCSGQALHCGTEYVFRAFAHNDPRSGAAKSDFSSTISCSTAECGGEGCTLTQGYWKTHGPVGCATGNNTNQWFDVVGGTLIAGLTLGTVDYDTTQVCSILNTPAAGNGLLILAHQLIAAKLNILNGAATTPEVLQAIIDADALIGNKVIPPVGAGTLSTGAVSTLNTILTNYNEGAAEGGPGHCSSE